MKKIKTCLIILGILSITAAVVFGKPFINYVQEELLLLGWEPVPSGTVRQQRGSWDADDRGCATPMRTVSRSKNSGSTSTAKTITLMRTAT